MDHQSERLSVGDALFLHLEREEIPLTVGAVCYFDGKIDFKDLLPYVESKLPLLPRYVQRVVPPPLGFGVMMWQGDEHFDLRNHVREIKLKRGTDAELQARVDEIVSCAFDRRRPLWDLTLFNGMKSGGSVLLARIHHCLADGIAGVGILKVIMDASPSIPKFPRNKRRHAATQPMDHATRLLDQMTTSWFSAIEGVLSAESELLRFGQMLAGNAQRDAGVNGNGNGTSSSQNGGRPEVKPDAFKKWLPEFAAVTPRLPFNIICHGPQKFVWGEVLLPKIKDIKNKCGTTVNDVVLALVTMVVKKYAQLHETGTSKRTIRIVIPVNLRADGEPEGLGNNITFIPMTMPLGIKDPAEVVAGVHQRTQVLKAVPAGDAIKFIGTILGSLPTGVQAALLPLISTLPLNLLNLICTNIPGPQTPLYVLGKKMLTCYPRVPIGGELGMNVAVITYNGTAFFGFTCDAKAVPDTEVLPGLLAESFAELETSVLGKKKRVVRHTAVKRKRKEMPVEEKVEGVVATPEPIVASPAEPKARKEVQEKELMAVGA